MTILLSWQQVQTRIVLVMWWWSTILCRSVGAGPCLAFTSPRSFPRQINLLTRGLRACSSKADEQQQQVKCLPPWNRPPREQKRDSRVRQHVNPLASLYQQPTFLAENWPKHEFDDLARPLHLDIGCGRGGFLLDMAKHDTTKNYLGLEIRPSVYQYAFDRIEKHGLRGRLTYVGCNVNVDLERILGLYQQQGGGPLETVSIQFPDPHFKSKHAKRRVVTPGLVLTLAKFMPESSKAFIQSDVKDVLDDMRLRFREHHGAYFRDEIGDVCQYMDENPIGIQTERERSVLARNLPVYRTVLHRTVVAAVDE